MKNKSKFSLLFTMVILLIGISGCTAEEPLETNITEGNPYPIETEIIEEGYPPLITESAEIFTPPTSVNQPQNGLVSLNGLIYTPSTNLIVNNTTVYLTPAEGDNHDRVPTILFVGGLESHGDIITHTDDHGVFEFINIPAGNYYLVVSYANTVTLIGNSEKDSSPKLFTFKAGDALALGTLYCPGD